MSSDEAHSLTRIGEGRFKRSLFGYRPGEVDAAIAGRDAAIADAGERLADAERLARERGLELEARGAELARKGRRIAELEQVATRLAERVVDRERELRALRAELVALRTRGDPGVRVLAALADDLERTRRQARGQATRMRMRALGEAAELARRVGELSDRGGEAPERLIEAVREAVERIGAADSEPDPLEALAAANGHRAREPGELFEGLVEVEVGPLSDFSQLVGFEDAAAGIGATSEVSVKRFAQGRATLAMRFKHPVALLRELEERAPFEFQVRDTRSDRVVLDVDD